MTSEKIYFLTVLDSRHLKSRVDEVNRFWNHLAESSIGLSLSWGLPAGLDAHLLADRPCLLGLETNHVSLAYRHTMSLWVVDTQYLLGLWTHYALFNTRASKFDLPSTIWSYTFPFSGARSESVLQKCANILWCSHYLRSELPGIRAADFEQLLHLLKESSWPVAQPRLVSPHLFQRWLRNWSYLGFKRKFFFVQ